MFFQIISAFPGFHTAALKYEIRNPETERTSGGLHLKGFLRDVFEMTRAAQTKASYHEFEKQIY